MKNVRRTALIGLTLVGVPAGAVAWSVFHAHPARVTALPPMVAPAARIQTPAREGARTYSIETRGSATITMTAPLETIRGDSHVVGGQLSVDLGDLSRTRGEVDVDLGAFETHTFDDEDRNATQTAHARNWFEIGPDVATDRRDSLRWARFAIDGIDVPNGSAWRTAPSHTANGITTHTLTLTAHGRLTVHGITVSKDVTLDVGLETPATAGPDTPPARVSVRTHAPFPVRLREHDVRARDTGGALITRTLAILGQKVAEVADVSIDVAATPASPTAP